MKLLVFFVCLGVALSDLCARIGDSEQQVLIQNLGAGIDRDIVSDRAKVVVFTTKKTQYAVGILDGKVESEIYTNNDDSMPDKSFMLGTLRSYEEVWFPIECGSDCYATVSANLKYFAKFGPSKELKKQNVFWVFTDTWREFVMSRRKLKELQL